MTTVNLDAFLTKQWPKYIFE